VRDERGRKVYKREIVARFHLPADQQGAEAIVPTVRAFHDPPAGLPVDATDEGRLALLANVRDDAAGPHGAIAVAKGIAFVQAAVLRAAHPATRLQDHGIEGPGQRPFVVQVRAA